MSLEVVTQSLTPLIALTGGLFKLELFLPEEYPMSPPKVRFLTKIYHPNIGAPPRARSSCVALVLTCTRCRQAGPHLPRHPQRCAAAGAIVSRRVANRAADKWSPALQIRTVLLSVQALLSSPNPDDPLAADVAKHYKEDLKGAQQVSQDWTRKYAAEPAPTAE